MSELLETDVRLQRLARGMPNALLLENKTGDLQLVVSALASPFRSTSFHAGEQEQTSASSASSASSAASAASAASTLPQFPYGAIYEYHCRDWVKAAAHVRT